MFSDSSHDDGKERTNSCSSNVVQSRLNVEVKLIRK